MNWGFKIACTGIVFVGLGLLFEQPKKRIKMTRQEIKNCDSVAACCYWWGIPAIAIGMLAGIWMS